MSPRASWRVNVKTMCHSQCGHHRRRRDRRLLQSQWQCLLLGTRQLPGAQQAQAAQQSSCRGLGRQPVPHDCGDFVIVESGSGCQQKPARCRQRRLILIMRREAAGLPRRQQRLTGVDMEPAAGALSLVGKELVLAGHSN